MEKSTKNLVLNEKYKFSKKYVLKNQKKITKFIKYTVNPENN